MWFLYCTHCEYCEHCELFFIFQDVYFLTFMCNFLTIIPAQASDMVSTSRILVAVVQMCYEAKDWDALNENIMLLSKRRSQLKQVRYFSLSYSPIYSNIVLM